jgi:hypothetical protein
MAASAAAGAASCAVRVKEAPAKASAQRMVFNKVFMDTLAKADAAP